MTADEWDQTDRILDMIGNPLVCARLSHRQALLFAAAAHEYPAAGQPARPERAQRYYDFAATHPAEPVAPLEFGFGLLPSVVAAVFEAFGLLRMNREVLTFSNLSKTLLLG